MGGNITILQAALLVSAGVVSGGGVAFVAFALPWKAGEAGGDTGLDDYLPIGLATPDRKSRGGRAKQPSAAGTGHASHTHDRAVDNS